MRGDDNMKKLLFIIFISVFLLLGTSCKSQKEYDEYNNTTRALNLMNNYNYETLNSRSFTLNKLSADMEFSGIDTLWELDCLTDDMIKMNYHSKNDSGEFKVLLVTADEKVRTIFENSDEGIFKYKIPKGKNYIRIVGNLSNVAFSLDYEVGQETKILMNDVIEDHPDSLMKKIF